MCEALDLALLGPSCRWSCICVMLFNQNRTHDRANNADRSRGKLCKSRECVKVMCSVASAKIVNRESTLYSVMRVGDRTITNHNRESRIMNHECGLRNRESRM